MAGGKHILRARSRTKSLRARLVVRLLVSIVYNCTQLAEEIN